MSDGDAYQDSPDVAIIGMAGRFPGAATVDAFWEHLCAGREAISFFSDADVEVPIIGPVPPRDSSFVRAGGVLEGVELFDAAFFGFSPREAMLLNPQHRLFLECAWEALETAGYDPERFAELIGVYAGSSMNTYVMSVFSADAGVSAADAYQVMIGNDKDFLATQVGYKLNLRGPCVTVQTACSTSLVAVHMACQALLSYQCDMALAGGVAIRLPQRAGYTYQEGGIFSPDGHCRAFDGRAQGTVPGSGVGLVVLRRLADAVAQGDRIQAVIRGSALNNDGARKVGFTAPSVDQQARVIAAAHAVADVAPETIGFVEAHGTGTPLGDPIEVAALTRAFRAGTSARGFCALGSLKTNVGHLDAAAGVAGLMKATLALERGCIPPSLHFTLPNPAIDFANSPFYVNTSLVTWLRSGAPRRAGVSSFGMGGTNAHVVLEEAPVLAPTGDSRSWQVLMVSAKTGEALEVATDRLRAYVESLPPDVPQVLADCAYTLQVGRRAFRHRRVVVGRTRAEVCAALAQPDSPWVVTQRAGEPQVAFLFPGQGAQFVGMGRVFYRCERFFREMVDRCAALLRPHLGVDVRVAMGMVDGAGGDDVGVLEQTWLAQPALFVVAYALASLWMRWGVKPQALLGHSVGEYVAACVSGVFDLPDALALVARRGRLMQGLPPGAMVSVPLSEGETRVLLDGDLALAAVNGPRLCVVSGTLAAIDAFDGRLRAQGVVTSRLHTSHAFHSAMVEAVLPAFTAAVAQVQRGRPRIPFLSNVTGGWITDDEAMSPHYWAQHMRQTVRFADGVGVLLGESGRVVLEVGPGQMFGALVQGVPGADGCTILSSLGGPRDGDVDVQRVVMALGRLWLAGVEVDWGAFYQDERRRRVALPTYPFERQRYWVDARVSGPVGWLGAPRKRPVLGDWSYLPSWEPLLPSAVGALVGEGAWVLLMGGDGLGVALADRLLALGQMVVQVVPGVRFEALGACRYVVDPLCVGDYVALFEDVRVQGMRLRCVVCLWMGSETADALYVSAEGGCMCVMALARAVGAQVTRGVHIAVVAHGMAAVTSAEVLDWERAALLGPCTVIPQEYPLLTCQCIDVDGGLPDGERVDALIADVAVPVASRLIAYRGRQRWREGAIAAPLPEAMVWTRLRHQGVYVITGGFGRIGLTLAHHLARRVQARLILVGRGGEGKEEARRERLAHVVDSVRALGGEVALEYADVADEAAMVGVLARAEQRFGALHGVFHAAGAIGEGVFRPISETTLEDCVRQLRPKVQGLATLARVLEGRVLEVGVLFSSLSATLGGLGYAAYGAANQAMDALAHMVNQAGGTFWMSVNWDAWDFGEAGEDVQGALSLSPDEGMAVLDRLLALPSVARVIVSTGDLSARRAMWGGVAADAGDDVREDSGRAARPLHARPQLPTVYRAPRDAIEQQLARLWEQTLGVGPIGVEDDFFALGGHSLLALHLAGRIQQVMGRPVALAALLQEATIARVARMLREGGGSAAGALVVPIQPLGSLPPLFFVHPAGGSVLKYVDLARYLGSEQPLYGLQARGVDGVTAPHEGIVEMAREYVEVVRGVQAHGPYHIGGWSMGGVIAFEMAQQLRAVGEVVRFLGLVDSCAVPPPLGFGDDAAILAALFGYDFPVTAEGLRRLTPDEQLLFLVEQAKQANLMPASLDVGLDEARHLLHVWKVHAQAVIAYQPAVYAGDVVLFRAQEQPTGDADALLQWGPYVGDGMMVQAIPGNHATMMQEPHVAVLAEALRVALQKVGC